MAEPSTAPSRFLVSARKYRPQTFDDLVAQQHVTATLRNAIALDRLAHAYLFSGPRGVGKTTAARLLAKAINCETPLEERDNAEPCRTCNSCRAFEEGRDLNVIEMDAASNNSVDDVRDLRETVRVPPQGGRKKVYILDEIHMLSNQAFNAFLKTLEEPPPHALFIFATTEPHKVLPTILSRCQRFDFRRISVEDTVARLREICESEGIAADDASLHLLARKADGALRDALSLFDQAVALCGDDLRYEELAEALGVVAQDLFFDVVDHARNRDSASLLHLADEIVRRGYDLAEFLTGLTEHLRHLYVGTSTKDAGLIEADSITRARYLAASEGLQEADLLRMMTVADDAERALRSSPQPRLTVELALLRLAHLDPVGDLQELIAKLDRLEQAIASGKLKEVSADKPKEQPVAPRPAASEPTPEYRQPPPPKPPEGGAPPAGGEDPPAPPPRPSVPSPSPGTERADPAPKPEPTPSEFFSPPALKRPRRDPSGESGDGTAQPVAILTPAAGSDADHTIGRIRGAWPALLSQLHERSPRIATCLGAAEPDGFDGQAVAIAVPDAFSQHTLRDEQAVFSEILRELLGEEPPPLAFVVRRSDTETATEIDPFERLKQLRTEHPTLRFLSERFGAEIVFT